jgi:hypothetical protein
VGIHTSLLRYTLCITTRSVGTRQDLPPALVVIKTGVANADVTALAKALVKEMSLKIS